MPEPEPSGEIRIEVESTADGSNFEPFEVRSDGVASGGQYIPTADEGQFGRSPPDQGRAEYTFEVPKDGEYAMWGRVRIRSRGNTFHVSLDGDSREFHGELTEGWFWTQLPHSTVSFSSGTHTLTVSYREDGAALDKLLVIPETSIEPSSTGGSSGDGSTLADGQSAYADHNPSRIEAENYDEGGGGVAYHDSDANNQGGAHRSGFLRVNAEEDVKGGAGGFEWYVWQDGCGPGDPLADDFRRFEEILLWSGHLLEFFQEIPYWEMESDRGKVRNGDGYLLETPGEVYAVYLPGGDAVDVDIASGTYDVRWFNPENGNFRDGGSVSGGTATDLPSPPFADDAAAIIKRT